MTVTDPIRALILRGASAGEIRRQAMADGVPSLRWDGWRHVLAGASTIAEVLRVTKDQPQPGTSA